MDSRPVILDTNFLMIPFQFKINILVELDYLLERSHHYVVSSKTMNELGVIAKRVGKHGSAARLALKMIESHKKQFEIVENDLPVDDWIYHYAKEKNAIVCTNDAGLRRRLRETKMKVISMKSKAKIGFV